MGKKRIIKDYDQMPRDILTQLQEQFPYGYQDHLLRFNNANGELVSALPFETDDVFYLVRMNVDGGYHIIEDDDMEEDEFDGFSDEDIVFDEEE